MNFNSEKFGYKNSSAPERLSKKYATFFTIHGQEWRQIFEPIKTRVLMTNFSELKFINLERTYGVFSIFKQ